jgi:hypothetical protein
MTTDQPTGASEGLDDDPLYEEMLGAIAGGYGSAPAGEGVEGGFAAAAEAAVLVARGMSAPEAVAAAIGEKGIYGVPRTYGLIPRPSGWRWECETFLVLEFDSTRDSGRGGFPAHLPRKPSAKGHSWRKSLPATRCFHTAAHRTIVLVRERSTVQSCPTAPDT